MKQLYLLFGILFLSTISFAQKKDQDTTTSRTQIYALTHQRGSFLKQENYEVKGKASVNFTAIQVENIETKVKVKGCTMTASGSIWSSNVSRLGEYLDEPEIDKVIECLQYIVSNVNLETKPDHDVWIFFETRDGFQIGTKAEKGSKYRVYFKKHYVVLQDAEVTMSRKDLDEVLESFKIIKAFLNNLK